MTLLLALSFEQGTRIREGELGTRLREGEQGRGTGNEAKGGRAGNEAEGGRAGKYKLTSTCGGVSRYSGGRRLT